MTVHTRILTDMTQQQSLFDTEPLREREPYAAAHQARRNMQRLTKLVGDDAREAPYD